MDWVECFSWEKVGSRERKAQGVRGLDLMNARLWLKLEVQELYLGLLRQNKNFLRCCFSWLEAS